MKVPQPLPIDFVKATSWKNQYIHNHTQLPKDEIGSQRQKY